MTAVNTDKIYNILTEEARKRGIENFNIVKATHYNKKTGMFFTTSKIWNIEIGKGQGTIRFTFDDQGNIVKIEENLP